MTIPASNNKLSGDTVGIAGAGITIKAVELLVAGFAIGFEAETVGEFETGPGAGGRLTTSEIVAEPPLMIAPKLQMTVDVPAQFP